MSIIVHRCECGHIDLEHANSHGTCSFGYCKTRCVKTRAAVVAASPVELVTTYTDTHEPTPGVVTPGEQFGSLLGGVTKTCGCAACRSFAESVSA